MPGYIARALQLFEHPIPSKAQHAPHQWQKPNYGAKVQYTNGPTKSPALNANDTKRVQQVLGTLLFYARAVDSTMLPAIGSLATQQANATADTMDGIIDLLNYAATHPSAVVRYTASDMCLYIESDASYLSEPKARSRAAGYHYLGNRADNPVQVPNNGAINIFCQILREIVSSAAEAELAGVFHNAKEACPIRITLEELGHPQPATQLDTDNTTAVGIANDTVKQKRSKAIDMRYYWVRDRAVKQNQFKIQWKPGKMNRADYFTKHHPATHHQQIRSAYLYEEGAKTKNYFEVLQEEDKMEAGKPTSGEGVLIPGTPGSPRELGARGSIPLDRLLASDPPDPL